MDNNKTTRNRTVGISSMLLILIVATISTSQLSSMITNGDNTVNNAYAKYSNSQTQSLVNDCQVGDAGGANCAINGPQTQGDGTASTPLISQISNPAKEGPPGPPGPQGPQGIQGEQGPPGPDKELQVRTVLGDFVEVQPGSSGVAEAECDADEVVTGGGVATDPQGNNELNNEMNDLGSPANAPNRWVFTSVNEGPNPIIIRAFAECAKLVDAP